MWICPKCKAEIEFLNYNATITGTQYGTVSLSTEAPEDENDIYERLDNYETDDEQIDQTDNYEYTCPECEDSVSPTRLIWKSEKSEKEPVKEEPEETLHKIITPKNNILSQKQQDTRKDTTDNAMICINKKCKYIFVYEKSNTYDNTKEEFYECPKCGTENSKKEYLKTIEKT